MKEKWFKLSNTNPDIIKNKPCSQLTPEEYQYFCDKKGKRQQQYWNSYVLEKEKGNYAAALDFFASAFRERSLKAISEYSSKALQSLVIDNESLVLEQTMKPYHVGLGYHLGLGFTQNYEKAFWWYSKAAEEGDAQAQNNLAYAYSRGLGIAQNREEAIHWSQKAAHQGYIIAQYNLTCHYYDLNNLKKAFKGYLLLAEQGEPFAQHSLGLCYEFGKGISKNKEHAFFWYKKAAEQGYALAQSTLGICYKKGLGIEKNMAQAVFWFRNAAEQGDATAQTSLGWCYKKGTGIEKNIKLAIFWLRKAAQQGLAVAQNALGYCYTNDEIIKDLFKAFFWYKKAAKQGLDIAQNNLAFCYRDGDGVVKDLDQAIFWFRKAAEQGAAFAQFDLGDCYKNGVGVVRDIGKAIFWYKKAAEQNHSLALNNLREIKTPYAHYCFAWVEDKPFEIIDGILTIEEVQNEFLDHDLIKLSSRLKEDQTMTLFINSLLERAQELRKDGYSFLTTCLLKLDEQIRCQKEERDEYQSLFMTLLVNHIDYAAIKKESIEPLVIFFSNQYFEGSYSDFELAFFVDSLIKIWHRAHTFDTSVHDVFMGKILASVVLHYCYKGQYCIQGINEINLKTLGMLIAAYEEPANLPAVADYLLSQKIIMRTIKDQVDISSLLSRLNVCITQLNAGKQESPSYFSLLQKSLARLESPALNEHKLIQLFDDICQDAECTLKASERLGLFMVPLQPEEKRLAMILQQKETKQLLQWIDGLESRALEIFRVESN